QRAKGFTTRPCVARATPGAAAWATWTTLSRSVGVATWPVSVTPAPDGVTVMRCASAGKRVLSASVIRFAEACVDASEGVVRAMALDADGAVRPGAAGGVVSAAFGIKGPWSATTGEQVRPPAFAAHTRYS